MIWARCPKRVLCCINGLQICEAVTTSKGLFQKKANSGFEDMEFPGGLKK